MDRPTLYTSIPPRQDRQSFSADYGEAYQRECVASWHAAGFRVVSLNSDSEIESLHSKGLGVEFLPNGTQNARTKIDDFLSAMAKSGEPIAGIINADCYLVHHGAFIQSLLDAARGSLVVLRRLNLDQETMRPTGQFCCGFDAFLLDTRFAGKINDGNDWSIGEPYWDYWFAIAMLVGGAPLKAPAVPALVHLGHEQKWQFETSNHSQAKMWRNLVALYREQKLPRQVLQAIEQVGPSVRPEEVGTIPLLDCIVPWLMSSPEQIRPAFAGAPGDFVCRMLAGLEKSDEFNLKQKLERITLMDWLRSNLRRIDRVRNRIQARLGSQPSRSRDS